MTSPSPTIEVTALTRLKADAVSHRERLSAIKPEDLIQEAASEGGYAFDASARLYIDARVRQLAQFVLDELGLNLAPMFESAVDAIGEDVVSRVDDLEDAVQEIREESDDSLTEETASQILAVFQMARALANKVLGFARNVDAVTRQRLQKEVRAFQTSETAVRQLVEAITLVDDEEEIPGAPAEAGVQAAVDDAEPEEGADPQAADAGGEG